MPNTDTSVLRSLMRRCANTLQPGAPMPTLTLLEGKRGFRAECGQRYAIGVDPVDAFTHLCELLHAPAGTPE